MIFSKFVSNYKSSDGNLIFNTALQKIENKYFKKNSLYIKQAVANYFHERTLTTIDKQRWNVVKWVNKKKEYIFLK